MGKCGRRCHKFLADLQHTRQFSEKTILAYQGDLNDYASFLSESGEPNYLNVDYQDLRIYLSYLYDKGYSRSSISRKLSSLRSFYQFLLSQNKVEENPVTYVQIRQKIKNCHVSIMKRNDTVI